MDWRNRPGDRGVADRIVALACAARLTPVDPRVNRHDRTPTAHAARAFADWLESPDDEWDAYLRRFALAYACDQPGADVSHGQVLNTAKAVYRFLTTEPRRRRPRG